ncbi:MAG: hypothetical protein V4773_22690 [Verrucomicrobiota bacterium]
MPADVVACLPLLSYGFLMAFVGLAYLEVGHWPRYSQPDPKNVGMFLSTAVPLGAALWSILFFVAVPLAFFGVLAVGVSAVGDAVNARPRRWNVKRVVVQLAVSCAALALFMVQLGGLMGWLMD